MTREKIIVIKREGYIKPKLQNGLKINVEFLEKTALIKI